MAPTATAVAPADAQVFTFSSGATVDIPAGFLPCASPDAVTFDCGRSVPVGTTPAGEVVFSSFSCGAYARLGHVYDMRRQVAEIERQAERRERAGRTWQAGNLRRAAEDCRARDARVIAAWGADPAPCTCR